MEMQVAIFRLLYWLGLTANYTGFFQLASALQLCVEQPQRLTSVTKTVYPAVAKQHQTNWRSVERNIRTAGDVIWQNNKDRLELLAQQTLDSRPRNVQLLAILLRCIMLQSSSEQLRWQLESASVENGTETE